MIDKICYWDLEDSSQKERDATPVEQAEIDQLRSVPPSKESINAPILAQIVQLDVKRIRPLAEGDSVYLARINAQIKELRAKLVK